MDLTCIDWFVKRNLSNCFIYGQVIKKRRKNRICSVQRTLCSGSKSDLEYALEKSEDSTTLNTSFVERHNLTIRQGCAYLRRRTSSHSREKRCLKENIDLFQCYYNFIRPHSAFTFGTEVRTPAEMAGLVRRKLSFRDIFSLNSVIFLCAMIICSFSVFVNNLNCDKFVPNNT